MVHGMGSAWPSAGGGMGRQRWSLQGSCCQLGPNRQALSGSCLCRWFLSNSKGRDSIAVLAADPPIRPSLVGHFLVPRQSIWMAEHQPCSHSVLNLHGQGRDAPQQGAVQIWPHISSTYAVPCSSHVICVLGRTVATRCLDPSKAAFTLSSVRDHTETIAGSVAAPLPYPSCFLTGRCLSSARWTQSPSTFLWGSNQPRCK